MKILIINSGSSSIKYQVISMPNEQVICKGFVERIGEENSNLIYTSDQFTLEKSERVQNHQVGLQKIVAELLDSKSGILKDPDEIEVIGHRVVHGGNSFSRTTLITDEVKQKIKEYATLAPLHNPHNLAGILVAEELFQSAKQVAVFDTAFHQTIPEKAKKYAIPNEFYDKHGIQVYGFHGTSHKYVSEQAIDYLQLKESKIISIHLGNGCSITAIENGKSVDHSLGFAPSNGLIMGSRSGDIDHSIIFYLAEKLGYSLDDTNDLLIKKSGMLGLTGHSDLRNIQEEADKGNKDCILALQMNAYRIQKYIGAYISIMNGVDAIVLTGGIGENSSVLRTLVLDHLDFFGIQIDEEKNKMKTDTIQEINKSLSKVKLLVIPTNEELEIARQVFKLFKEVK
ncbi:acetate kinase [bacterium]|nr:acetate kinase [bacterium]